MNRTTVPPQDAPEAPERRGFFRTAAVGAAGALAGATHGKFGLSPITPAQAQGAAVAPPRTAERAWCASLARADRSSTRRVSSASILLRILFSEAAMGECESGSENQGESRGQNRV